MPYATHQDIVDRYGEEAFSRLAEATDGGAVDATTAIADASDEIDSYLAARYELPLATAPQILVRVTVDIAVYRMAAHASTLTDEITKRYDDAVMWLARVAKGTVALPGQGRPAPSTGGAVTIAGPDRQFTRDGLKDF